MCYDRARQGVDHLPGASYTAVLNSLLLDLTVIESLILHEK